MQEELKMVCEIYIMEARANLRREEYWINKSVALRFTPDPLPVSMLQLPILTAANYKANLGDKSDRLLVLKFYISLLVLFFLIYLDR
jgi:hypothetical protein